MAPIDDGSFQVLTPDQWQEIFAIESKKLETQISDPMKRAMVSWNAKWRQEALEHYLNLGWSLGCRSPQGGELVGYFLAQPLLFFRGYTQSLWVEHVSWDHVATRDRLVEYAIRLGREKHLQRVIFADRDALADALAPWTSGKPLPATDPFVEVATTKT